MRWTLPNTLTILRLLAAPGVAVIFLLLPRPAADWLALIFFVCAAVTDWFDGHLARKWQQVSKLGAMLDPIADKAMVVIALAVLVALSGMDAWILLPATVILFREVFVSGLREYLGDTAGLLKVTTLAKWKTTAQMVSIAVLFGSGIFAASGWAGTGAIYWLGTLLLWIAALLTAMTGWDYFSKAQPHLRD